jgi:hypothetical protein
VTEQRLVPIGGTSPLRSERKREIREACFTGFRRRGRTWRLMRSGNLSGEARLETATEPSDGGWDVSARRPDAVTQRVVVATDKPVAARSVGGEIPRPKVAVPKRCGRAKGRASGVGFQGRGKARRPLDREARECRPTCNEKAT